MRGTSYPFALVSAGFVMTGPAQAHKALVPAELTRSAECMLDVLKKSPDVSEPRLSNDTSEGWFHPYLEYKVTSPKPWRVTALTLSGIMTVIFGSWLGGRAWALPKPTSQAYMR